jgi:hypothetical protein
LAARICTPVSHVLSPLQYSLFPQRADRDKTEFPGVRFLSLFPRSSAVGPRFRSRFTGGAKISRELRLAFSLTIIYACEYHTERNAVRFIARSE